VSVDIVQIKLGWVCKELNLSYTHVNCMYSNTIIIMSRLGEER